MSAVVSRAANRCHEHQLTLPLSRGKSPGTVEQLSEGSVVLTHKPGRAGAVRVKESESFVIAAPLVQLPGLDSF